jgi:hypothetical protein
VLVRAPSLTDIAFRMAAGIALLTAGLDTADAARRWLWCQSLRRCIAAEQFGVAMHRALSSSASTDAV